MYLLSIKDTVSQVWYSLCEAVSNLIKTLLSILPDNPFSDWQVPQGLLNILGYVNWFLPIAQFKVIILAWLAAMATILTFKILFNYFKVFDE